VDVGANHGYYTMLLADAVGPDGRVLAIEPNPSLASLLTLNVEVNGFASRTAVAPKAATDGATAQVRLAIPPRQAACGTIAGLVRDTDRVIDVEAVSIDELTQFWPRVDLIKVDAEGAEDLVWRGMRRTIEKNPQLVVILEFVPARYRDAVTFVRAIQASGFEPRVIAPDSCIEPITVETLLTDGNADGWMLFLQRL
jgi:FkbM family methyltransferase